MLDYFINDYKLFTFIKLLLEQNYLYVIQRIIQYSMVCQFYTLGV